MIWTEKYAPRALVDIIGHGSTIEELQAWIEAWKSVEKPKPLLIHGSTGVGKTALVTVFASDNNLELLEMNASDMRTAPQIEKVAGIASVSSTFSGNMRLILFDEVDNILGSDRGGASAVLSIIKSASCPVILIANDLWDKKISSIRAACQTIELKKVHYATIANLLAKIADAEKIKVEKPVLVEVAKRCHGDVRSAINDFQVIADGRDAVISEDVSVAGERDLKENIFNAIRTIMKTSDFHEAMNVMSKLDEQPDFVIRWVEENIPKEYLKPADLYAGFEQLSRADIFFGRVHNRQKYQLWRYANVLMTAGVALAKAEKYNTFTKYSFPSVLSSLSKSKSSRNMRQGIGEKVGLKCHASSKIAVQDYLPMIYALIKTKKAADIADFFDFNEDELEFLGVEDVDSVLANVKEIKEQKAREKIVPDVNQKSLGFF